MDKKLGKEVFETLFFSKVVEFTQIFLILVENPKMQPLHINIHVDI